MTLAGVGALTVVLGGARVSKSPHGSEDKGLLFVAFWADAALPDLDVGWRSEEEGAGETAEAYLEERDDPTGDALPPDSKLSQNAP